MVAVLVLSMLAGCGSKTTGSVTTDGSTSMEKVIGALGEAFQNDTGISFTYNPTGSGSGLKAVQEGRWDIGLSSRDLKAEEKEAGLNATVLAYDGIAIIVHPENPVNDLSLETIAKIYTDRLIPAALWGQCSWPHHQWTVPKTIRWLQCGAENVGGSDPGEGGAVEKLKASAANVDAFIEKAKCFRTINALTPELLRLFVQRIEIGEQAKKYSHSAAQDIRIVYRDIGMVDSNMEKGEQPVHLATLPQSIDEILKMLV